MASGPHGRVVVSERNYMVTKWIAWCVYVYV